MLYNAYFKKYQKYRTTLKSFNIYSPMTAVAWSQYKLYSIVTLSMCLSFMLSTNFIKLYNMYYKHPDGSLLVTHLVLLLYFIMSLIKNDFANRCFIVYSETLTTMKTGWKSSTSTSADFHSSGKLQMTCGRILHLRQNRVSLLTIKIFTVRKTRRTRWPTSSRSWKLDTD